MEKPSPAPIAITKMTVKKAIILTATAEPTPFPLLFPICKTYYIEGCMSRREKCMVKKCINNYNKPHGSKYKTEKQAISGKIDTSP